MNTKSRLKKRIMRRVYYTFGIRIATHPLVTHTLVLGLSVIIFARLVHVAAVYRNVMQIQVGELGAYLVRIVMHSDFATLMVIGLMVLTILSFRMQIPKMRQTRMA